MAPQIITEEVVSARAGLRPKHSGSIVRKIIIFFFCYGLEMAIERTPLHKTLEPTVYSWFVKKDAKETETNLFVVDISDWIAASSVRLHPDVPSLSFRSGRDYTDRTALIRLLELLNEFGAKAVGFDIDLSMPPLGEAPPPQHNQFLEFASNLLRSA